MSAPVLVRNLEQLISENNALKGNSAFMRWHFKATTIDEQVLTYQYLEWMAHNDGKSRSDICVLKDLNMKIRPRAFLTGSRLTAVDLLLASDLYRVLEPLQSAQKETLGSLLRWYNAVSAVSEGKLSQIYVHRMPLYS
ncbi:hypothetical protein FBUS_02841 [Fasciolopsis buskii]|uniref:GST C-terminal domain-containing protein n=1 Tax=Fasciolopsis buskii TaxID=27845 RepID=A0A8E0VLZ3_9TREM|nr:hypothetical protein FBUS_02841 [Fasciolopsis buski]